MATFFGIDSILLSVAIIVGIIILVAVIIIFKMLRDEKKGGSKEIISSNQSYQIESIPKTFQESENKNSQPKLRPIRNKDIPAVKKGESLSESLSNIADKYSIEEITLATSDGLLLASSIKNPSTDAVARYPKIYAENLKPWPPGITLFGIEHKGSLLVGIVRSKELLTDEIDQDMLWETKDILNWWI